MIEAEWWEYDSAEEMADAVAGDVGFIIESAIDARDASLLVLCRRRGPSSHAGAGSRLDWIAGVRAMARGGRSLAADGEARRAGAQAGAGRLRSRATAVGAHQQPGDPTGRHVDRLLSGEPSLQRGGGRRLPFLL